MIVVDQIRAEMEALIMRRYRRRMMYPIVLRVLALVVLPLAALWYWLAFPGNWWWPIIWVVIYTPLWLWLANGEASRARRDRDDALELL